MIPIIGNKKPNATQPIQHNNVFFRPYLSEALPINGAEIKAAIIDNERAMPVSMLRLLMLVVAGNNAS